MQCMNCGAKATKIRVFTNGAVHTCNTHYADIKNANTDNYSPRRYRKFLEHPHKITEQ